MDSLPSERGATPPCRTGRSQSSVRFGRLSNLNFWTATASTASWTYVMEESAETFHIFGAATAWLKSSLSYNGHSESGIVIP
jgi:hypothetical protein